MSENEFHKKNTFPGIPHEPKTPLPELPKFIGPYKIESLLEKGGMSILYLGTHPETKEPTTIKVLSPRYVSHPEIVKRFLNEAEIIAMADHPNIVKLYGHGQWEGGLYIAMEFIQGISLRQMLLQSPMSLKRSLEIVIDIGYALCHLHTHGVIHRDLKPENILVTENGQIKVIDFGISQLLTERTESDGMPKQQLIGTPIYMSPEQQENPEKVSYPSDIYSLGIITYELVSGKLSHGQIHLSLMPKGLQKILNRSLQLKPEDRYQDIVDFITDVSAYLNSSSIEKEKKVSDQLSEFSENLKQAQLSLAPDKPPEWPNMEIGLISYKGANLYGIYHDFFQKDDASFGIMIGESSAKGAESVIYTAMLRGMIRSLSHLISNPLEFITMLNQIIVKDNVNYIFSLCYLILSPKENKLYYLSCGYGNLWIIKAGTENPIKLTSNNLALGIDLDATFSETSHSWEPGDCLVFSSFLSVVSDEAESVEFSEEQFRQTLIDNAIYAFYPPKRILDSIFRKIKITSSKILQERSLVLISVLRKD